MTFLDPSFAWAAGGIVSNARDLTKFFSSLFQGRLIPPAQLSEMKTGSAVVGYYGLGLQMTTTKCGRAFGHAGAFPGHRNIVWSTSNGRRVAAVMINTNQGHVVLSKLWAVAETALCSGRATAVRNGDNPQMVSEPRESWASGGFAVQR